MSNFKGEYIERNFFESLYKYAKRAGVKLVYYALILYFTLQDGKVPVKIKGIIISTLGYLFLPTDMVPDMLPALGMSDDLVSLIVALAATIMYVTPEIKAKAKQRMKNIFGNKIVKELATIDLQMMEDIRNYRC